MGKVSVVASRKRQYLRRFLKNGYLGDGKEGEPEQSRQRGRYEQRHLGKKEHCVQGPIKSSLSLEVDESLEGCQIKELKA